MEVPVLNLVDNVDLTEDDVLLPLMECIVNSIISLQQSSIPKKDRKIQIELFRGDLPAEELAFSSVGTITGFRVADNGIGFNTKNYQSFNTPFSQLNKEFGCKGIGRITVLAAFASYEVVSNFIENGVWKRRKFTLSTEKEVDLIEDKDSESKKWETIVSVNGWRDEELLKKSALTLQEVSEAIMQHCFIYYLSGSLPTVEVIEPDTGETVSINRLFSNVSKEKERSFNVNGQSFSFYITKIPKEGNRKNNYLHYCANNRAVGSPKNLKTVNSLFSFPILIGSDYFFFDIYLVSEFLDKKVYRARNGFNIQKDRDNLLYLNGRSITFQDIEEKISSILEAEYEEFVRGAKNRNVERVRSYIKENAPRYRSFLKQPAILDAVPANLTEDKLEEHLYRVSFNARKTVEQNINKFIKSKEVNDDAINRIIDDLKAKTAYDVDSLADYMMRRKAIINLFDKFLDADENGTYKLEEDVHSLIFPMGLTNNDLDYENHNLWLLDERFVTYRFIGSDRSITSYSQVKSSKETDLVLIDKPEMFENPIGFGDKSSGEVNSMVIFEFKRPGETAHQKSINDFRWEFSELVEKYFDEFLYKPVKKNYKGNQVVIKDTTPKFGYIILDVIPSHLATYNKGKGWKPTPFGTFYKINPELNTHYEAMTFRQLVDSSKNRHNPFFDKLFI